MKKIMIYFCLVILASSCVTLKQKEKICAECPTTIITQHDSIYVQQYDTILKEATTDSMTIRVPVFGGISDTLNTDTMQIKNPKFGVIMWIKGGMINMDITHNNDSIEKVVLTNTTSVNDNISAKKTIIKTQIKKVGRFYVWYFWINLVCAVLLCVYIWAKNKYLKNKTA